MTEKLPTDPIEEVTFTDALTPEERPTQAFGRPASGLAESLEAARSTFLDLDAAADEWSSTGVAPATPLDDDATLKAELSRPGARYGPFQVTGPLGEGAMSIVVAGRHVDTGHPVAIKILWVDFGAYRDMDDEHKGLAEATIRERFRREAIAISRLRHPNIISVYSFGIHKNHPFMVLERLDQGTVRDRLEEGSLPIHQAVEMALGLLSGLECAHAQGFLHRDIKPENVMLDAEGRVKIADFGLVRLLEGADSLTRAGSALGTPNYMAPEQAAGKPVDVRADLYAAGATIFTFLCGSPPFAARNMLELAELKAEDPPSVREKRSEVPEKVDAVVRRLLAPRPEDRYASAAEASRALAAALPRVRRFAVTLKTAEQVHTAELVEGAILLLGRSSKRVDFAINDPSLSRCHCLIQATAHGLAIVDLNSSNGTFVAKRKVTCTQPLRNGEVVEVGETSMEVSWTALTD